MINIPTFYKEGVVIKGEGQPEDSRSSAKGKRPMVGEIRRVEKGKTHISDFIDISKTDDPNVPPPSPPKDFFHEEEPVEQLDENDRAMVPSVISTKEVDDERAPVAREFMSDDNFVNSSEFKSFWLK